MTDVSGLSVECTHCGALKFEGETEFFCYMKSNVQLKSFPQPQPLLQHLHEGVDSDGKHFLADIRRYNNAFQMTSFGCNEVTMLVLVAWSFNRRVLKVLSNLFY